MEKLTVEICVGTSCHLLGAQDLLDAINNLPEAKKARLEVSGVHCLKNCGKGPNVRINGVVLSGVTPERMLQVIDDNI